MNNKKISIGILVLLLGMLLLACSTKNDKPATTEKPAVETTKEEAKEEEKEEAKEEASGDSILKIALTGDPGNNINPLNINSRGAFTISKILYSPLYRNEPTGREFYLAESIESSEDGLEYTVKLKDSINWHDGEKFTADDVVFSFERFTSKDETGLGSKKFDIEDETIKIEKVDDNTVKFVLPKQSASFETKFTDFYIIPKHIYENVADLANNDENGKPVGNGPFIFEEYKEGEYVKYKSNENYFAGAPKVKGLILQFIPDDNVAKMALEKGDIDVWSPTPEIGEELSKNEDIDVYKYSEGLVTYLGFNISTEATSDINLRKALLYSLDRETLIKAGLGSEENGKQNHSFLPLESDYRYTGQEKYEQNLDLSKEYLEKSATKDSILKICYPSNNTTFENMALTIQSLAKEVGIKVELFGIDWNAYYAAINTPESSDYDLFLNSYIYGLDPASYAALFVSTGQNTLRMNNKEIDELFKKGEVTLDINERKEIFNKVQELVADEAVMYPIADSLKQMAVRKNIGGIEEAGFAPIYGINQLNKVYFIN